MTREELIERRRRSLELWHQFTDQHIMTYASFNIPPGTGLEDMVSGDWEVLEVDLEHGGAALLRCGGRYLVATRAGWIDAGYYKTTLAEVYRKLGTVNYHDRLIMDRLADL